LRFNAGLLFLFFVRTTGRAGASFFVAMIFALHPLNVESVAWVADARTFCAQCFSCSRCSPTLPMRENRLGAAMHWCSSCFASGLASKPMVITLPFVLLLLDYWPLQRTGELKRSRSRLVVEKLPLFLLSAASAYITMLAQRAGGALRSTEQFSIGVRISNAIYAYAMYLWKMVCPARSGAVVSASRRLAAGFPGASGGLGTARNHNRRLQISIRGATCLVGWLWFLGTLVPVIGLMQVGDAAMADRYAYIPLIGIFPMIAFGIRGSPLLRALGLAWTLAQHLPGWPDWHFLPCAKIDYWRSSTMWSHALRVTQNNFVAEE